MWLARRTVPFKIELACSTEARDDAPNWLGIQIRAANLPRSTGSGLLSLQQTRLHQTLDGAVTDTTHASRFAQADSCGIGERSPLTCNRMVMPGSGHTVLIPRFSFPRAVAESVQHGSIGVSP